MHLVLILACADPKSPSDASTTTSTTSSPCATDEVLDGDVCVPIACGTGPWGGRTGDVYVDASVSVAGDGTAEAPFASIGEGMASLADQGGTLLVAAGSYPETLTFDEGHDQVEVVGRCAEMVTLDGSDGEEGSLVVLVDARHATRVGLAGLTVSGGQGGGVGVLGGQLTLSSVVITDNKRMGLYADASASEVTGVDLVIQDTTPLRGDTSGRGVQLQRATTFTCTDCRVERNVEAGVLAAESHLVLTDVTIADTAATAGGDFGIGVELAGGSDASFTRVTVGGSHYVGVEVDDSVLIATDTTVTGTATSDGVTGGVGLYVIGGGEVTWSGGGVSASEVVAVSVADDAVVDVDGATLEGMEAPPGSSNGIFVGGGAVTLTDAIVSGMTGVACSVSGGELHLVRGLVQQNRAGASGARAVEVSGGLLRADDTDFLDNAGLGVVATGEGAEARLDGCDVSRTGLDRDGEGGYGLGASGGGHLDVRDTRVTDNVELGIWVTEGGTATLTDVTVSGTLPDADATNGIGLAVTAGGAVDADGLTLTGNHTLGAIVDAGTATLTGLVIGDTKVAPDGDFGRGMTAQSGAMVTITDAAIERSHQMGVVVSSPGTALVVDAVTITDTVDGSDPGYAVGLQVEDGAGVTGSGLTVDGARYVGVLVYAGATASLSGLTVRDVSDVDGGAGHGVVALDGALLTLDGALVEEVEGIGVLLSGVDTAAEVENSVVRAVHRTDVYTAGFGMVTDGSATLWGEGIEVADVEGPGLLLVGDGSLACADCFVHDVSFAGLVQTGGTVTLDASVVSGVTRDAQLAGGLGVFVSGPEGGAVTVSNTTIDGADLGAVWTAGAAAVLLDGDDLTAGPGIEVSTGTWALGAALYASAGTPTVRESWLHDGRLGVLLVGASAVLVGDTWTDLERTVRQQDCDGVDAPEGWEAVPDVSLCDGADELPVPTSFGITFADVTPVSG